MRDRINFENKVTLQIFFMNTTRSFCGNTGSTCQVRSPGNNFCDTKCFIGFASSLTSPFMTYVVWQW